MSAVGRRVWSWACSWAHVVGMVIHYRGQEVRSTPGCQDKDHEEGELLDTARGNVWVGVLSSPTTKPVFFSSSSSSFLFLLAATTTATTSSPTTNILLPLYVYPGPGTWDPVYTAIKDNPTLQFQVVINPSSGPGPSSPPADDSRWVDATATINSFDNARTFGYVHLLGGAEPPGPVEANITAWAAWATYGAANISVHGIFFDETPDNRTAYMRNLTSSARTALGPGAEVIFNPGKAVLDDAYFSLADHVVVSELAAADYTTAVPTDSVPSQYASRASILVYNFNNRSTSGSGGGDSEAELRTWLDGMVKAGIGSVNVVDYGWDASESEDAPADIGTVASLLVQAAGGGVSRRSCLGSSSVVMMVVAGVVTLLVTAVL